MKKKLTFYSEAAYAAGIVLLALGTALMEQADFGLSMVVAPAYLLHLKISQVVPLFSFGMAEYTLQAVIIVVLSAVLGKFKPAYLFSFVTAVAYGFTLDGFMALVAVLPPAGMASMIVRYILGFVLCAMGVAFLFHTYIPPEAYELFVKEVSAKLGKDISVVKTIYDCGSCLVAIGLSFAFFGLWHFEGVKLGTVICAFLNGFLIGQWGKLFESVFDFKDALPLRAKM